LGGVAEAKLPVPENEIQLRQKQSKTQRKKAKSGVSNMNGCSAASSVAQEASAKCGNRATALQAPVISPRKYLSVVGGGNGE
jgi:hypothetical protein